MSRKISALKRKKRNQQTNFVVLGRGDAQSLLLLVVLDSSSRSKMIKKVFLLLMLIANENGKCSNMKLMLSRLLFSNSDFIKANLTFKNLEDGVVVLNGFFRSTTLNSRQVVSAMKCGVWLRVV